MQSQEALKALAIVPKVSGAVSIIGSTCILNDIFMKSRKKSNRLPINLRILVSLSISDIIASFFAYFLSTWMVPSDTPSEDVVFAAGNDVTCNVQGFLTALTLAASNWSIASLAISSAMIACWGWSNDKLLELKWQIPLVVFPWIYGLACGIYFQVVKGYRYNGSSRCLIGDEPFPLWVIIFTLINVLFLFISICSAIASLVKYVYQVEMKLDKYQVGGTQQTRRREKTIRTAKQGIWYTLMWLFVATFIVIGGFVGEEPVWFWILYGVFVPLQGLFNAWIYFRERIIANRRKRRRNASQPKPQPDVPRADIPKADDPQPDVPQPDV
mmetsp:Transcript_16402/g.21763  ORF Transcript_16402/g.21763 Transcript_16402/m.21763 type:complete len:327 (-) Transcript_16402:409-1389(-)